MNDPYGKPVLPGCMVAYNTGNGVRLGIVKEARLTRVTGRRPYYGRSGGKTLIVIDHGKGTSKVTSPNNLVVLSPPVEE